MVYPKPILLIDDDENSVILMKTILENEGYSVDYALDGHKGLNKVTPGKYAAVIIDYLMPYLRGDEFAERIRLIDGEVGLILLTGFKAAIPPETLGKFNSALEKPVDPAKIINALRALVNGVHSKTQVAVP